MRLFHRRSVHGPGSRGGFGGEDSDWAESAYGFTGRLVQISEGSFAES